MFSINWHIWQRWIIYDFFIKRTIIGGSFNYLLTSVPLLGYVFVTGGFTYTFYYIFSNQYANNDKKLRELRNVTIGSAASVGSGLLGAVVGANSHSCPDIRSFCRRLSGWIYRLIWSQSSWQCYWNSTLQINYLVNVKYDTTQRLLVGKLEDFKYYINKASNT